MMDKLTVWFEKLSTLSKALISISSGVVAIAGFLAVHDAKVISGYKKELTEQTAVFSLRSLQQYQVRDSTNDSQIIAEIEKLTKITGRLKHSVDSLKDVNVGLQGWFVENASTKDDVLRILDIFNGRKYFEQSDTLHKKIDVKIKIEKNDKSKKEKNYTAPSGN